MSKVQSPMSKTKTISRDESKKIGSLADFGRWTLDFGLFGRPLDFGLVVQPTADGGVFDDDCL